MNEQIQMQYSDLNFTTPIVASDGNMVMINDNGPVNLLFFQMRAKDTGAPSADVVAAVRLHSLAELKDLHSTVGELIKQHEDKEK